MKTKTKTNAVLQAEINERKHAEAALRESEVRIRRKLASILSPDGDIGALELDDFLDVPTIQAMMNDFFTLTKIGIGILDIHGNVLVATGWQDICTRFHRVHPVASEHCKESDTALSNGIEPGTFKIYKCKNNMWDMVTPIHVGDKHAGNLFLGQFLFDDEVPDYSLFRDQARQYGFDEGAYIAALDRVPRWNRETVDAVMRFYSRFANLISTLSYSNIKLAQTLAERDSLLESLKKSESRFRSYIDNAPIGVFITDECGVFLEANPSACGMTGYASGELLGMRIRDILPPESHEFALKHFQQVIETGRASGEFAFRHKSGHIRYWAVDSVKLSPIRYMGFVQDITERKRAEEQLEEYSERLEEMVQERTKELQKAQAELLLKERLAMLGHFAGSISHEIRTPLSVIDRSAYYLKMKLGNGDEKIRKHLEHISSNVLKTAEIIESLLNLTRMEKPKTEKHDLKDFIPEILHSAKIPDTVNVVMNFPDKTVHVDIDAEQIGMALKNIFKNAMQAMDESGTLTVTLRTAKSGKIELSVSDTGPGILPENIGKIFEPLFTTKAQGIGFGLSITQMIVEKHGGALLAESIPGNGAVFKIILPAGNGG